jgi:ABC-type sugar transport system ATPase subunit
MDWEKYVMGSYPRLCIPGYNLHHHIEHLQYGHALAEIQNSQRRGLAVHAGLHRRTFRRDATLDVVEPMGMETMVYFTVDGQEVCGRVDPGAATGPGEPMRLYADMDRMHLIDPQSGAVL